MSVFVWITYSNMQDTLREGKSVSIALRSLRILESIQEDMQQMETAERGYVITGNRQDLAPYFHAARQIRDDSITLHSLITDDETRRQKLQQLLLLVRSKIAFTDTLIRIKDSAGYEAASRKIIAGKGKQIMDSIHSIIYSSESADRSILKDSNAQRLKKAEYTTTLFFILSGIFFLGFIIAYFIIQRNLLHQQHHQAELLYLSTLVKQTSETIFSTDADFIIRSWNKAAEKMYQYTWQEAVGKSMQSLFTVCLGEGQKESMLSTLQLNGYYNNEFDVIHQSGQILFVEASITVLRNGNGAIDGYVAVHKDISDRKKLEDELRKLNEGLEEKVATKSAELTHIFERITDAFVALDNNWCYTYVNQRAGEIIDMAPSELIGKNIWEIFPEGKNHQLIESCRQAVSEQQYYYLEEYYPNADRWFENHLYPSPKGLSIFFRDITEEKKVEQALHESGEKYRSLIELAADAILINQDGLIRYANPAALKLFECSGNDDLMGKKFSDLFHPDYYQLADEWLTALMDSGNSNFFREEKIIQANGNTIDVEVVANLFNFKGSPAIEMVIRNLSERKEAEKKLRASDKIFNHSVDLLCIAGLDGYFKVVNPAWTKILGWTMDELLARPWIEFVHPDDRERSQNPGSGLEKEENVTHIENRCLCKDGTWKWISWNSFAYPMEEEIFGVGRDITASKKIEDELFKSNQLFQNLAKVSPVGIFRTNLKGDCLYVNERWCVLSGLTADEAMGTGWLNAIHPDDKDRVLNKWYSHDFEKVNFKSEYRLQRLNGFITWVIGQARAEYNHAGEMIGFVGSITDISEIKLAERLIKNAVEGLRKAQHYAHVGSWTWHIKTKKFEWSDEMYNIFGVARDNLSVSLGEVIEKALPAEGITIIEESVFTVLNGAKPSPFELDIRWPDNTPHTIWAEAGELILDDSGNPSQLNGIVQDITHRKQSELKVIKATRLYEFISQVNQLMLRSKSQEDIFSEVCSIAVKYGKFRMAWIGLLDDASEVVKPTSWAGFENGYLSAITSISAKEIPEGFGPTGKAIREKKCVYCNDIEHDPAMVTWRSEQLERGYRSSVSIPIFVEGKVIGAFTIYASSAFFFIPSEIQLMEEVTGNIGYALEIISTEKKRKLAEERLRKLSTAVEQSSASIVITDVKGNIEYVNPAFSKISGYSFNESLGKNPRILQSGLTDPKVHEQLWQNITAAHEWNGIFCNQKKNGELYWESATISPIIDDEGSITNFVAVKENITDKIKAEEQLHKEKELSDSIINSLPGIFYLYDQSGQFIRWNKNFETVSGYSAQEIKTMHPLDFYDSADQLHLKHRIESVLTGQKMEGVEVLLFTRAGKKILFFINSLSVVYEGKNCIMGTGIDITDRKKVEEENRKLAMIASLTINAVVLMDEEGYIQWVNKGFERTTQYTAEEVIGKRTGDFLQGPETDQETVKYMRKCIENKKGFKVELVNYNKSGKKYWVDIEMVPMLNEQNQLTGFMAMERDISDRKLAGEELLILNKHLQERAKELALSNTELERFAYVASHDLQEPLRMVSSFMDLLKRNYQERLDERASQYIGFAIEGAQRMKQLIMDLLEYSRVGTNKDEFVNTDVNKVVQDVAGIFAKQEEGEMPEISYPVLPAVMANKSQMAQLFQNLVGNAIKYKNAPKALIHINYSEDKSYFTFSVSDNGIGIDPVHYERIFILFQRLHLKDEYSGTGIGLTICKKIVEKHGGTIWVESKPGEGSTFYFTIKKQL